MSRSGLPAPWLTRIPGSFPIVFPIHANVTLRQRLIHPPSQKTQSYLLLVMLECQAQAERMTLRTESLLFPASRTGKLG